MGSSQSTPVSVATNIPIIFTTTVLRTDQPAELTNNKDYKIHIRICNLILGLIQRVINEGIPQKETGILFPLTESQLVAYKRLQVQMLALSAENAMMWNRISIALAVGQKTIDSFNKEIRYETIRVCKAWDTYSTLYRECQQAL